ncbi:MAG: crossover junction endodeoxyribonuclease RuvC [Candidatus Sungbacteria bacterium]|uniref:Crossover junction endodeoxyribonuclease RuvC n=1 Tax=Candidatus Sungiibacteriota bacterium TaxID=2750080 RepID=A0A932YXL3_9BACT|nr:crossover junction endodeoxyribonuclease RuvC [Candidatus Sungbacteria bacterium]
MAPLTVAGIDPGTTRIGYALVRRDANGASLLCAETIAVPGLGGAGERLAYLSRSLGKRLRRDRPNAVAVEKLYFSRNAKTALAVAEARGIILLTAHKLVPSIWEYAPLTVKLAVTGYGRADKAHVHRAVRLALPGARLPNGDDAIDAIAIALTAIHTRRITA